MQSKRYSSIKNEKSTVIDLFQTCVSYFPLLNIKEDISKNAGNQTVDGSHLFP